MKDQIIKFLAHDGKISVICASTTNLVEESRKLHDLSPLATAAMGRVLTITSLIVFSLATLHKKTIKEDIIITIKEGTGTKQIANILKSNEIIKSKYAFISYIKKIIKSHSPIFLQKPAFFRFFFVIF